MQPIQPVLNTIPISLPFSNMYKYIHSLWCSYLYRRTYTHAHTPKRCLFKMHWKAQRTNQYIHKFLKEKMAVTQCTCTSIMTILTTFIAICVQIGHLHNWWYNFNLFEFYSGSSDLQNCCFCHWYDWFMFAKRLKKKMYWSFSKGCNFSII